MRSVAIRLVLLFALTLCWLSLPSGIVAQTGTRAQLGFVLDGSNTIAPDNFQTMTHLLANALSNAAVVPRDGSLEICVVQIGVHTEPNQTRLELEPTVITEATLGTITSRIRAISQGAGYTPIGSGIRECTRAMKGSPNWAGAASRVINLATDGTPYDPSFPDDTSNRSTQDALSASAEAKAAGITELDVEVLGNIATDPSKLTFFRAVVFPQPPAIVPPDSMKPGFVRLVANFPDFEGAVLAKVPLILTAIPPTSEPPTVTPVPSVTPGPTEVPEPTEIPEPSSLALLASGLSALGVYATWWKRRSR